MRRKSKFILNVEEFERLCFEKGWDYVMAANHLDITREYLWMLRLPPDHKKHSRPSAAFARNASKVFGVPIKQLFFLDSQLQPCNSSSKLGEVSDG
jgi:hypothetical protein